MEMNIVEALNSALREEMRRDKRVMVLGEDVGIDGGVFRVTDGLLKEFGEERVVDTPLAESGIMGASVGLALNGMKPVAEMQFDGFFWPAFDQLISHASRYRNRTQGRYSCPVVVRFPVGGGVRALEHHAEPGLLIGPVDVRLGVERERHVLVDAGPRQEPAEQFDELRGHGRLRLGEEVLATGERSRRRGFGQAAGLGHDGFGL